MSVVDITASGYVMAGQSLLSSLGLVWTEQSLNFTQEVRSVAYGGNGVVVACGDNGEIARSTDYGVTWSSLISNPMSASTAACYGLAYGGGVFVIGNLSGETAYSTDAGATWTASTTDPPGFGGINGMGYGSGTFIAVSGTDISRSTDGGDTWSVPITNPFTDNIWSVSYGNGVFVAVGESGQIARSTNGGTSWGTLIETSGGEDLRCVAYGDNIWIATGLTGAIYRSTDAGVTWSSVSNPFGSNNVLSATYNNGSWITTGGAAAIARSTDGGLTWGASVYGDAGVSQPFGTDGYLISVASADTHLVVGGYLVSDSSPIIATSNYLEAGAGIVEQGSNANGEYVVFSNGRVEMTMWGFVTGDGANWYEDDLNNTLPYPSVSSIENVSVQYAGTKFGADPSDRNDASLSVGAHANGVWDGTYMDVRVWNYDAATALINGTRYVWTAHLIGTA